MNTFVTYCNFGENSSLVIVTIGYMAIWFERNADEPVCMHLSYVLNSHYLDTIGDVFSPHNPTKETKSSCQIWSPCEFGSIGVNVFPRIIRLFRNPFQNTLRYRKLSDSAEPNKMSLFHATETINNRLFNKNKKTTRNTKK